MVALANKRSDAIVGKLTLIKASDSIAITRVHFSSILGRPLFFASSGAGMKLCLDGGSVASWSNSVNSSSLTVPSDALSS